MQKIRFINGAALYPMVTMNGEECHNEWKLLLKKFIETEPLPMLFLTMLTSPMIIPT